MRSSSPSRREFIQTTAATGFALATGTSGEATNAIQQPPAASPYEIYRKLLTRKLAVAETGPEGHRSILFLGGNVQNGDEIWEFHCPQETPFSPAGFRGQAVIRNGQIVDIETPTPYEIYRKWLTRKLEVIEAGPEGCHTSLFLGTVLRSGDEVWMFECPPGVVRPGPDPRFGYALLRSGEILDVVTRG